MDKALKIASEFYDKSIRAEVVLHLATMCLDSEAWSDSASEAFAEDADMISEALGIPELADDAEDAAEITDYLRAHNRYGFLIQFGTPKPQLSSTGEVITATWGWTRLTWIYAENYDDACRLAITWRDDVWAKCTEVKS